jgi:hypothetical protein
LSVPTHVETVTDYVLGAATSASHHHRVVKRFRCSQVRQTTAGNCGKLIRSIRFTGSGGRPPCSLIACCAMRSTLLFAHDLVVPAQGAAEVIRVGESGG